MTRFLLAALALILIAVAAYACDLFAGLPPDLTGLVGLGAVALVLAAGAFAIGRWGRG